MQSIGPARYNLSYNPTLIFSSPCVTKSLTPTQRLHPIRLPLAGPWQRLQHSFSSAGVRRFELVVAGGLAIAVIGFALSIDSVWQWKNRGVRVTLVARGY